MEFERHRIEQQEVKKSSLLPIIGASLLVHIALGAWIFYSHTGHKAPPVNAETKPIEAKLVFVDLAKFQPPTNNSTEEIDEQPTNKLQEVVEPLAEVEIDEPADQIPTEVIENEPVKTIVEDRRDNLPVLDMPEDIDHAKNQTDGLIFSGQAGSGISRDLARQHLQNYHSQAVEQLSSQQAKRYQQTKTSPDLQLPEFDPFTTEDEKYRKELSVRVDCSSTLNKSLSVLSGITGGGLKCSDGADLTPFLKKHLNKGIESPDESN